MVATDAVNASGAATGGLGVAQSEALWGPLQQAGYIDAKGKVQDTLRRVLKDGTLHLPEPFQTQFFQVQAILHKLAGKLDIKDANERQPIKTRLAILHHPEFKALWDRIKHRTTYRVQFDNEKLLADCAQALQDSPPISKTRVNIRKADLTIGRGGVSSAETVTALAITLDERDIILPDLLTALQDKTQLTRRRLVRILNNSRRLDDFSRNPQQIN